MWPMLHSAILVRQNTRIWQKWICKAKFHTSWSSAGWWLNCVWFPFFSHRINQTSITNLSPPLLKVSYLMLLRCCWVSLVWYVRRSCSFEQSPCNKVRFPPEALPNPRYQVPCRALGKSQHTIDWASERRK